MKLLIQNFISMPLPWLVLDTNSLRTLHDPLWLQVDEWCTSQWGDPSENLWQPGLGGWMLMRQDQAQLLMLTWGGAS